MCVLIMIALPTQFLCHAASGISTTTSIVSGAIYYIRNANSGHYLDAENSGNFNVIQYAYHGGLNQAWKITKNADGYYTLENQSPYYKNQGRDVVLAAADTFRAAAAEQLTVWAERAGVPIIKHGEGADPAAVVFDAAASFKARNRDMLLCDTAGRLHNKKNLMNELEKMRRVLDRELPGVPVEALMVLDATTGQNAIAQARAFGESAGLTGIILTKLDGTAKGGVAVAVKEELKIPVRFVGVGEGIDDMQAFDPDDYARALLSE